jgi:hypothetical protein
MANHEFSNGAEVIAVYGQPLQARRKTTVQTRYVEGDRESLRMANGEVLEAVAGVDYVMIPEVGHPYPCKIDIFNRSWEPDPERLGWYRRKALCNVIQVPEGDFASLNTLEGKVTVQHPDYIAIGIDDEVYFNTYGWAQSSLEFLGL